MARPSSFTQEAADAICELLADGQSLRAICRKDEMPGLSTVFRWLAENQVFREQYARAREAQADALFEDIVDIADDETTDVNRARLKVDARKWAASKLKPRVYGEKLDMNHSGDVGLTVKVISFADAGSNTPA